MSATSNTERDCAHREWLDRTAFQDQDPVNMCVDCGLTVRVAAPCNASKGLTSGNADGKVQKPEPAFTPLPKVPPSQTGHEVCAALRAAGEPSEFWADCECWADPWS